MEVPPRFLPDRDLVARCLGGDLKAFDVIVERYRQRVVSLTTRMTGDPSHGEEIAQETFLRAYTRLALYDRTRPFHPWLFRIAVNLCLNQRRGERPREEPVDPTEENGERELVSPAATPAEVAEARELQRSVRAAMLSLPPRYRAAVTMRYVAGLDYSEIAQALEVPIGTVKTHLFRAKELLREKLRDLL